MKRLACSLALVSLLASAGLLLTSCSSDDGGDVPPGPYGVIRTWAGTGDNGVTPSGTPLRQTELAAPQDVTFGPDDTPYIVDWNNHRILEVRDGDTHYIIGTGTLGDAPEGPALVSGLNHPTNVSFDPQGRLIMSAWHNSKIMRYDFTTKELVRVAGVEIDPDVGTNRGYNGDDIPAIEAWLDLPVATAFDSGGNMYIADQKNVRIRRVNPVNGEISSTEDEGAAELSMIDTIVGTGDDTYNGDGLPADETTLNAPGGQAAPPTSRLIIRDDVIYFADTLSNVVRMVDLNESPPVCRIIAGGGLGVDGNGVPRATVGNDYDGTSGDGGPATQATLNYPTDVALDSEGNLYISDTFNSRVRRVDTDGIITTFAGRGRNVDNPDELGNGRHPTDAWLDRPYGVAVDREDNVYIVDTYHHMVRIVPANP